jgi:uncharacterized protein
MKMASGLLITLAAIYLSLCAALYFYQDKFIFFPPPPNPHFYEQVKQYEYFIKTNNETLHGWNIYNENINHDTSIIYFGGNAEDVTYNLPDSHKYSAKNVFFTNHPGYGKSTGTPSEDNFYNNALQAYDEILNKHQLNEENVIIMGRSIGSSVATYVSSKRGSSGLILITPFDSIENIAANQFSLFPVSLLLKHKFKTIDFIDNVKSPILIIASDNDEIIPNANLLKLYNSREEKIQLLKINDAGHNDISNKNEYFPYINEFILSKTILKN